MLAFPADILACHLGALSSHESLAHQGFLPGDGPETPVYLFFESLLQMVSCPCLSVAQKNMCFYKEDMGRGEGRIRQPSVGAKGLSEGLEKWIDCLCSATSRVC